MLRMTNQDKVDPLSVSIFFPYLVYYKCSRNAAIARSI